MSESRIPNPESRIPSPEPRSETTIQPHTTNVVVWDIPSAVVVGERFRIRVGVRCSQECTLANNRFEIRDADGAILAATTVAGDVWPGTTALYFTDIELTAPHEEGLYTWSVTIPAVDDEVPHAEGVTSFGIRVVAQPQYLVTIEAVDEANQSPLGGARIVMHPYRAVADERGVARVRVAKGAYKLFVSQPRYVTVGLPVQVDADMTARAALYVEPVTERN